MASLEESLDRIQRHVEAHLVESSDQIISFMYGYLMGVWVKSSGIEKRATTELLKRVKAEAVQRRLTELPLVKED